MQKSNSCPNKRCVRLCCRTQEEQKHIVVWDFIEESKIIINEFPFNTCRTEEEHYRKFLDLPNLTIESILSFISFYDSQVKLRDQIGMDIKDALSGGPRIKNIIDGIILQSPAKDEKSTDRCIKSWKFYIKYSRLMPFTSNNERSALACWFYIYNNFPVHDGHPQFQRIFLEQTGLYYESVLGIV
jgi:hypothetical protein